MSYYLHTPTDEEVRGAITRFDLAWEDGGAAFDRWLAARDAAALTSAAPAIQAAAIAEALEQLAVSFEATASCASYVGTEDIMETWLNAAQRARKAIEASK